MLEFSDCDNKINQEIAGVGAGIGGEFYDTTELRVMKYNEAMKIDREGWTKAVQEEHQRMVDKKVWTPVKIADLSKDAKIMTSTWAMKKKSNGTLRARINARGYEQIDGEHYDGTSIHAPVTNESSVRIVMILGIMAGWEAQLVDVKGAFLCGKLNPKIERMYLKVPQGFEKYYDKDVVLMLLAALYGTK